MRRTRTHPLPNSPALGPVASCSKPSRAATCLASAGVPGCAGWDTPAASASAPISASVSLSSPRAPARLQANEKNLVSSEGCRGVGTGIERIVHMLPLPVRRSAPLSIVPVPERRQDCNQRDQNSEQGRYWEIGMGNNSEAPGVLPPADQSE